MLGAVVDEVLEFWFGQLDENGFSESARQARWFVQDDEFDAEIRRRFQPLIEQAERGGLDQWLEQSRTCLAFAIVTDQFPRNVYRGSSKAFATDTLALSAVKKGIRAGFDKVLTLEERGFFYLPFEHSEDLIDQHTSVGLFTQLRDDTMPGLRHLTGDKLKYAHQHRDIIERFGRFPHRNRVLSRTSSAEEEQFAAGGGFGQ